MGATNLLKSIWLGNFLFVYYSILKIKVMSKKEIQSQIQKLDGELSTIINVLMIIVGFFLVEVILLACNFISIDIFSILGLTGLIGAFYVQFKSARMKARILVILENLNKNI